MTVIDATPTTDTRVEAIFTDLLGSILEVLERHRVTWPEYRATTEWLVQAAQQGELPLLLDVFLSSTVEGLNTSADGGTETNIEGPFYLPDAPILEPPFVLPIRAGEPGERLVFSGTVRSVDGTPLAGATLDVWQANGAGEYSHFSPDVPEHNLRGQLATDAEGRFSLETVLPSPYQIPHAGPTGQLLDRARPAQLPARPPAPEGEPPRGPHADHPDLLRGRPVDRLRRRGCREGRAGGTGGPPRRR